MNATTPIFHTSPLPGEFHEPQTAELLRLIGHRGCIAGGFARHELLSGTPYPSDIDIFCTTPNDFPTICQLLEGAGYTKVNQWHEGIRTAETFSKLYEGFSVQVIKPDVGIEFHGTPAGILSKFDFTVNQFALRYKRGGFWATEGPLAREDHDAEQLRLVYIHSPLAVMHRAQKYIRKGYRLPYSEIARIFDHYNTASDEYKNTIRDLVSMDVDLADHYGVIETTGGNAFFQPRRA